MKITHVWVARSALDVVLAAAADGRREEPCGLLLGYRVASGTEILEAVPVHNSHPSPERGFQMEPEALVVAGRAGRARGLDIVGFWHGHREGPAWPGPLDGEGLLLTRGEGLPPQVHLVVGRGTSGKPVVRAFREGRTRLKLVPLTLLKRARGRAGGPSPAPAASSAPQA